ncbi:MAG TPA: HdeD family acid-resistance protein [Methylophaga sp.]|nr:MAG: hypothetical protein DRQ42_04470 [Gammaproteobacteria bacterium]HHA19787.1 HdeD family acid-resistance protein [Methylophaga sp.]
MSQEIQNIETPFQEEIGKNTGLVIFTGAIILFMGLFAMSAPLVAGLSLALMVGMLLIISGIGQLVFAVKTHKGILTYILGILTVVIGGYMVTYPGVALASLTLFLSSYLIISGIFEIVMAFQVRPVQGWGWALFSGVISMILGMMIWNQFPLSGAWAIGIIIGVRLFFSGLTLIMFGSAARNLTKA